MPELPDVEGFRRALARDAAGRTVVAVTVPDAGVLQDATPQSLGRALRGRRLAAPHRHGKWLALRTDGGPTVLVHPGMTGHVGWAAPDTPRHRHDRVVLVLERGEVRYCDQRKLRGLWLVPAGGRTEDVTGPLGPDAHGLRRAVLADRLAGRRGALKGALLDQVVVAGLGNLLADEVCWRACLHPRRRVPGLTGDDVARLHRETGRALRASIPAGRVPDRSGWLTGHRDRPDGSCPRCGTRLSRGRVAGRATVWCARCQPA
jgi:formamidopyrimidine-DNA glycosylase